MAEIGSQFGPYTLVSSLGAGAMGQVYRARDERLRRDVAIKVLSIDRSADADASARMAREAQVIASLSHPNILTIYDVGEQAGQIYLVTELVEGLTLRERMAGGPLPWRDAIDVARGVAAGLAAAHARGIVHRDIKPDNIIWPSGSGPKILDFGVAKIVARPDAQTTIGEVSPLRTDAGAAVGTVAYMAPEQLEGRTVDHRADQWAFGVMLQELLTGRRPFAHGTTHQTIAAILRDEPPALSALRPDLPVALSRIVLRCLSRDPNGRYASTADLALALDDVRQEISTQTGVAGVPPAPPAPRPRWWYVAAGVAVVAAIGAAITFTRGREPDPVAPSAAPAQAQVVAVLPFSTIGDGEAYLAEGITESVTRALGQVEETRVIASNSTFALAGRGGSYRDIGRELGVGLLVRGSVQRAGDRVRISAALIDPAKDLTLWSDRYDRAVTDILAVEDEIAWQIAAKMAAAVGRTPPERPSPASSTTPEAYDAYLRARAQLRARSTGAGFSEQRLEQAITEFQRAIAIDSRFALARAGLASAYTQKFFYFSPDPSVEQKAFLEIEKALSLNSDLAEAYLARAQLVWNLRNGFQHERSIADLRRAIAGNPSLAEAHIELGKVYYHIGLLDKAIAANEEALRLDPLATGAAARRLMALVDSRDEKRIREVLDANPRWLVGRSHADALVVVGDIDGAIRLFNKGQLTTIDTATMRGMNVETLALLASLVAQKQRRAEAEQALAIAIPLAVNPTGLSDLHHAHLAIATTLAQLGRGDEAIEWLTKAASEGYPSYPRFSTDPALASLRDHPGFIALLARLRRDFERWKSL